MIITQELSERNFATRRAGCDDILQNIPPGAVFISSDETHFHLSGTVNKQNFRFCRTLYILLTLLSDNPRAS
jgi:hypothetical protein